MKNLNFKLAGVALFIVLPASNAYAYLDPGTGSAILQGILGGIAVVAFVARLYWHRLLAFLKINKPKNEDH